MTGFLFRTLLESFLDHLSYNIAFPDNLHHRMLITFGAMKVCYIIFFYLCAYAYLSLEWKLPESGKLVILFGAIL